MPILTDYQNSIKTRWLNKPVEESKLLDDAEMLSTWQLVNVDQASGEMTVTKERAVSGSASIRLRCATTGEKPAPGRNYGTASARRVVPGEDWSAWNRISFWVYPDLPGFRNISMIVTFHNDGAEKVGGLRSRRWGGVAVDIERQLKIALQQIIAGRRTKSRRVIAEVGDGIEYRHASVRLFDYAVDVGVRVVGSGKGSRH